MVRIPESDPAVGSNQGGARQLVIAPVSNESGVRRGAVGATGGEGLLDSRRSQTLARH